MTLDEYRRQPEPIIAGHRWRGSARRRILRTLAAHPDVTDGRALLKLVDAAYPFEDRRGYAYKAWLAERQLFIAACTPEPTMPSKDEADACVVARDMVEEGRLEDAARLLEQAPNRLARECPVCGAAPGDACAFLSPSSAVLSIDGHVVRDARMFRPLLVPHHARLVGHLDAGPLFEGPR